jgi:hypothetical protein
VQLCREGRGMVAARADCRYFAVLSSLFEACVTWQTHFSEGSTGKLTATANLDCPLHPLATYGRTIQRVIFARGVPSAVMAAYCSMACVLHGTTEELGQLRIPGFLCSGVKFARASVNLDPKR